MATNGATNGAHFQKPDQIETRLFINGEFVPSKSGKKFDVYNPSTEKLAASVYEAGVEDVDLAVKAAKDAFPAWSALSAMERAHYLYKLADAMDEAAEEIAYVDAITMGKPVTFDSKEIFRHGKSIEREKLTPSRTFTPCSISSTVFCKSSP